MERWGGSLEDAFQQDVPIGQKVRMDQKLVSCSLNLLSVLDFLFQGWVLIAFHMVCDIL